uniref:Ulp1 protease family, C-terminal catalytic domain-containing protein n=1 Tax=Tanacetum cinerariifolium TaxID=118510 RepID=A0A699L3A6_TANCI|nr:ulp1 protease family, C-terminal catalytic domain-containing protein [Tanacetum cinerariifolium]
MELKDHVVGLLDLHDEWNEAEVQESQGLLVFRKLLRKRYVDLIKKAKEKLSLICAERVIFEDYMRKASLKCRGDGKFVALNEKYVNLFKDPISFEDDGNGDNDLIKKAEEKLSLICAERVIFEDYMRKASLKCRGDGKFVALNEKYVNLFKDPISFEDDGNGDNVGDDDDENGDDDENMDDDGGNVNNDVNGDSKDMNEGDKDPNGSNPSFGFSKISLEDFGNDCGLAEKDKAVEENTTEQGTVVEGNEAEEGEIMSTPENFTQWLEKNVDLVGEGDLFGDNSATLESINQGITPEKLPTQKGSPSPKKRVVKASSYLLSPYMNKKTNVVPKITRLEFILGNSLFAMQGDKIENIFEAHFGMFVVYGVRLNLETLAPGLCLDANVIDCWGTVLNHEQSF